MKAISLTQPYATLMAIGAKKFETRNWITGYRGPICIHASKGFPKWAREICDHYPFKEVLGTSRIPVGAIVAVADIQGCYPTHSPLRLCGEQIHPFVISEGGDFERNFGDYSSGRVAIHMPRVFALPEPVPCKGALSLWTVPEEVEAKVRVQIPSEILKKLGL
jgi:hypothetical protein